MVDMDQHPEDHQLFVDDESDTYSNISLTSTVPSPVRSDYNVDRILMEGVPDDEDSDDDDDDDDDRDDDEEKPIYYLVKWSNYPLWRSTWEPVESFQDDPSILDDWADRQLLEQQGFEQPFDLEVLKTSVEKAKTKTARRKEKRREKREQAAAQSKNFTKSVLRGTVFDSSKSRTSKPSRSERDASIPSPSSNLNKAPVNKGPVISSEGDFGTDSLAQSFERLNSNASPVSTGGRDAIPTSHTRGLALKRKRLVSDSPPPPAAPDAPVAPDASAPQPDKGLLIQANSPDRTAKGTTKVSINNVAPSISESGLGKDSVGARDSPTLEPVSYNASLPQSRKISLQQANARRKLVNVNTATSTKAASAPVPVVPIVNSRAKDLSSSNGWADSQKGTAKRTGTSIFSGWNDPKKRKGSRLIDAQKSTVMDSPTAGFQNLAIQNNVHKWAANYERIPDPNFLPTWNPVTGKFEEAPKPLRINTDVPTQPSNSIGESSSTSALREPSSGRTQYKLQAVTCTPMGKKARTCPYWKKGSCKYSAENCPFAHALTGQSARKVPLICKFLQQGYCKYTAEECSYLHEEASQYQHLPKVTHPRGPQPKVPQTCEYWKQGICKYSAERCVYLHESSDNYFDRRYGRREETPGFSGLRQSESDQRRQVQKTTSLRNLQTPVSTMEISLGSTEKPSGPYKKDTVNSKEARMANPKQSRSKVVQPEAESPKANLGQIEEHLHLPEDTVISLDDNHVTPDCAVSTIAASLCIKSQGMSTAADVNVRLEFDTLFQRRSLIDIIGESTELEVQNICLAKDFQQFCLKDDDAWVSGDVVNTETPEVLDKFIEYLVMQAAGAIIRHEKFLMVLYPSRTDSWDFIRTKSKKNSSLRFYVQSVALSPPEYKTSMERSSIPDISELATVCKKELGLSRGMLFQGNDTQLDKKVFLMFPSRNTPEAELITACLLDMGATIYHADIPGAWEQFRLDQKNFTKSGVVIFHPSVYMYHQIPFLRYLTFQANYNFFQLGVDPFTRNHKYGCVRLFPRSECTLITDEVFEYYPGQAADILETIDKARSRYGKDDIFLARPGLGEWIEDLVDKYGAEDVESGNTDRLRLSLVVSKMLADPVDHRNPFRVAAEPSRLISPPVEEKPDYPALWDHDGESATDWLVEWFAGWCIDHCETYRRFTVIHEQNRKAPEMTPGMPSIEKDPRGWSKKYQHVKVVNVGLWKRIKR